MATHGSQQWGRAPPRGLITNNVQNKGVRWWLERLAGCWADRRLWSGSDQRQRCWNWTELDGRVQGQTEVQHNALAQEGVRVKYILDPPPNQTSREWPTELWERGESSHQLDYWLRWLKRGKAIQKHRQTEMNNTLQHAVIKWPRGNKR